MHRGVKHACSLHHGTYPLLTFSPEVRCIETCSACLKIRPSEKFWDGVSCLSAVCLPVLFILMKEVKGEWLRTICIVFV